MALMIPVEPRDVIRWRETADHPWTYAEVSQVTRDEVYLASRQGAPRGAQLRTLITREEFAMMLATGNLEIKPQRATF